MRRSSRQKSSKHSSRDVNEYSDSERDSISKDNKKRREERSARSGSGEKRKFLHNDENGELSEEYSGSSKRRKDGADDGSIDRWNGGKDDRGEGSQKSKVSSDSKSKGSRRRAGVSETRDESVGLQIGGEEVKKADRFGTDSRRKEVKEGSDREKGKEGKSERLYDNVTGIEAAGTESMKKLGSKLRAFEDECGVNQSVENTELNIRAESRKSEPEHQPERRIRRRDGSGDGDKHQADIKDYNDTGKDGKYNDNRHKDDRYRDKYREDMDRDDRHRDNKQRDERPARDRNGSRSDDKYSRDEEDSAEVRQKKSNSQDSDRDDDRDRDQKLNRELDRDHNRGYDRESKPRVSGRDHDQERNRGRDRDRNREYKAQNSSRNFDRGHDHERYREHDRDRSRDYDRESKPKDGGRDYDLDRERNRDHDRKRDYDRDRERDHNRLRKDDRSRDYDRERDRGFKDDYNRDYDRDRERDHGLKHSPHFDERGAGYKDSRRRKRSPDNCDDAKSRGIDMEKKPLSSTKVDLDGDRGRSQSRQAQVDATVNTNRRRISPSTSVGVDGHRIPKQEDTKPSPMHLIEISPSSVPPISAFRAGVDNTCSMEENSRSTPLTRYKRNSDPNVARGHGNGWKGVQNWSSPLPNAFIPFQHGQPHGSFQAMMPPQFPSPAMFGVRPSMEINHLGGQIAYHIPDDNRFSAHLRPLGWQNIVDGSVPGTSQLHGWEGNNGVYKGPDWDHNRHSMNGRGWEMSGDTWKGQNGDLNMDLPPTSQKEDYKARIPENDFPIGQNEGKDHGVQAKSMEIISPSIESSKSPSIITSHEDTLEPSKISSDDGAPHVSRVYISKLDISPELANPELYNQLMGLVDTDLSANVDEYPIEDLNLKVGAVKIPNGSPSTHFPPLKDSIFQRAMELYRKQRIEMRGMGGQKMDIVSASDEEKVEEQVPVPSTDEEMVEEETVPDCDGKKAEVALTAGQEKLEEIVDIPVEAPSGEKSEQPIPVKSSEKMGNASDDVEAVSKRGTDGMLNLDGCEKACGALMNESESVILNRIHHSPESTH